MTSPGGCQDSLESERLRRIREAWHQDDASATDVGRLRARLLRSRSRGRVLLPRAVILVAASAICFVALGVLGAQAVRDLRRTHLAEPTAAPALTSGAPTRQHPPGLPTNTRGDAGEEGDAGAQVDLELGDFSPVLPGVSATPRSPGPDAGDAGAGDEWSRVSEALKRGDILGAQQELDRLSMSADVRERDAAKLAQAELLLKQGEKEKARPLLQDLADSGATPFIRRRAAQLMATLEH